MTIIQRLDFSVIEYLSVQQWQSIPGALIEQDSTIPAIYKGNLVVVSAENPIGICTTRYCRYIKQHYNLQPQVVHCSGLEITTLRKKQLESMVLLNIKTDDFQPKINGSFSNSSEIANLIEELFEFAVANQATDMHFEYRQSFNYCRIRQRINGLLDELPLKLSMEQAYSLANYLFSYGRQLNGNWQPNNVQDAAFDFFTKQGQEIAIRIATLPEVQGWDLILRFHNHSVTIPSLSKLGYDAMQQKQLKQMLDSKSGVIVFSGPTGSGKTTSMLALVSKLPQNIKIISVEQPVETILHSISQVSSANETNLADWIIALNRWDADVAIIGEVRDKTSSTALEYFASSGKQTLMTLHASSVLAVPYRLRLLGVAASTIEASWFLSGIINQRLMQTLCAACRVSIAEFVRRHNISAEIVQAFKSAFPDTDLQDLYTTSGLSCSLNCNNGYSGRKLVSEILKVDNSIRPFLLDQHKLEQTMQQTNWQSFTDQLKMRALEKSVDAFSVIQLNS